MKTGAKDNKNTIRIVGEPAGKMSLSGYSLSAAAVTDTRLMGAVGLHLTWSAKDLADTGDAKAYDALVKSYEDKNIIPVFHQFYLIDCEEKLLENLTELWSNDPREIRIALDNNFGGLGGTQIPIPDRCAFLLLRDVADKTVQKDSAAEESLSELRELIKNSEPFTDAEKTLLWKRMVQEPRTEYGAVHYFLMRLAGHDTDGADYLIHKDADRANIENICLKRPSVMRRDAADVYKDEDGRLTYLTETLLDGGGEFWLIFSEIELKDGRVVSAREKSRFKLSEAEANSKLRRGEFVSCYDINSDDPTIDDQLDTLLSRATRRFYDSGILYMEYNKDNNHVEQPVFSLADDLKASYFLTTASQLVIASYSGAGIVSAETALHTSPLTDRLVPVGRYSFQQPVLGAFIDSGYDDFVEYLGMLI